MAQNKILKICRGARVVKTAGLGDIVPRGTARTSCDVELNV